jgi:hypothetical protein
MKKSIKKSLQIAIFAILALGISNCDIINPPKKDDNSGLLLLGAFLLNQQSYQATVSIVGKLKNADGTDLANTATSVVYLQGSGSALESGSSATDFTTRNYSGATPASDNGNFSLTFRISSPDAVLNFTGRTNPNATNTDRGSASNYTTDKGSFRMTVKVNQNALDRTDQVTITDATGLQTTVISVLIAVRGVYSLPNPTVGEQVCDGNRLSSGPVVKQGTISSPETWRGGILLRGTVTVNSAITVEPGTVIFGERGSSLFILGANKLTAIGTAANPICWTSASSPGSRFPGDWGGIVTVGNSGASRTSNTEGTTPQPYGSGSLPGTVNLEMEYNIVEFGGNEVAPGDELNNLSMYASNTKLTNVQAHRGLDDQFEAWGGNLDWRNLLATGGLDDDYDLDEGVGGTITNAIAHKYPAICGGSFSTDPHSLEWDGIHDNGTPACGTSLISRCTTVTLNKFTLIGANVTSGQAGRLRERVVATITNGIHYGFVEGFNSRDTGTAVTVTNVRVDKPNIEGAGSTIGAVTNDLGTTLPITSDGGVSTNCGFGATKPDYTLISGVAATGFGGAADGKFWESWAVFRAR